MDAEEVRYISALVYESSKVDDSFGQLFNGVARDPTTIFSHTSMCPARVAVGAHCNCTFSRMNFNEMIVLDATVHSCLTAWRQRQLKLN